jgi:hypothetical protein
MKPKINRPRDRKALNQFYIKYFMQGAGNDSPVLDRDVQKLLAQLHKILL